MSSIPHYAGNLPPIAIDVENNRFAVGGPNGISVVQIDLVSKDSLNKYTASQRRSPDGQKLDTHP